MANIVENSTWESGVYQLETDDPVLGGPPAFDAGLPVTGHANAQAQQLANRTTYLKQRIDVDLANTTDPSKGAGMVGWLDPVAPTFLKVVSDIKAGEVISMFRVIPKTEHSAISDGTSTYDIASDFQELISAAQHIYFPDGEYLQLSGVICGTDGMRIYGGHRSLINSPNDVELIRFNNSVFPCVENLRIVSQGSCTKPHIRFANCTQGKILNCILTGFNDSVIGGGVVYDNGAGGIGGSMGLIFGSTFDKAPIDIKTWDVKIVSSWAWANTKPWAIRASGSVGNLSISDVDIVPPLSSVSGKKAGIYLSGAVTQPKLINIYVDGNPSLVTGTGILAENGVLGLQVIGGHSNECDEAAIVLDSVINPKIVNHDFFNNNKSNSSDAVDILLRQTFGQPIENPLIQGNTHLMASTRTTPAPAIRVESTVTRGGMRIVDNSFQQPGAGGGYTEREIDLVGGAFVSRSSGTMRGNAGTRTIYMSSVSANFNAGDTTVTLNWPIALAYRPRPDQVTVNFEGQSSQYRVDITDNLSIRIHFPAAAASGTVYVGVEL